MNWNDIQSAYEAVCSMSCVPKSIRKVKPDHIFDENKSVKWNREKVEINNAAYRMEVARLNIEKNKAREDVINMIIEKIQSEVGASLSKRKAEAIWEFAYEERNSYGFYVIREYLFMLINLAKILVEVDKNDKNVL